MKYNIQWTHHKKFPWHLIYLSEYGTGRFRILFVRISNFCPQTVINFNHPAWMTTNQYTNRFSNVARVYGKQNLYFVTFSMCFYQMLWNWLLNSLQIGKVLISGECGQIQFPSCEAGRKLRHIHKWRTCMRKSLVQVRDIEACVMLWCPDLALQLLSEVKHSRSFNTHSRYRENRKR